MGIPKKAFTKAAIGGMEATPGTAVERTCRVAVTDFSYLAEKPVKNPNDVITGRNTVRGLEVDAIDCTGELATNLAANRAVGMLLHSLMGIRLTKVQVGCGLLATYTGTDASCRLEASESGKTLKAYTGAPGAEILDTNFGSSGTLDLTGKTLGVLVADINGFTGYSARTLYGDATAVADGPVDLVAAQAKGRQVPVHFKSTLSGVYLDVFRPNLTNTECPTFSLQVDGVGVNQLGAGTVVDSATISGDLKARIKATWSLLLLSVAGGQTATTIALSDADLDSLKFAAGETYVAGKKYCYTKNFNLSIVNNHSGDEGYCQGSLSKSKHVRGEFGVTGTLTLTALDLAENPSTETERAKNLSNEVSSLLLVLTGRQLATGVKSIVLIDLPTIQYSEESKSAGDQAVDQSLSFTAVDRIGYDDFLRIHMLSADAT